CFVFFFQAEDGIRDRNVTGVQRCALPICSAATHKLSNGRITDSDSDKSKPRHLESDWQTNQLIPVVGFAIVGALLAFGSQAALQIGRASCRVRGSISGGRGPG